MIFYIYIIKREIDVHFSEIVMRDFKRGERSIWEKCIDPEETMRRNVCYFCV